MSKKRRYSEPYHRCIKCYDADHESNECTSPKLISCLSCFRLNVNTTTCNCRNRSSTPSQILRLVGKNDAPRWFIDVTIHNRLFAALVNPTIERGRISRSMAEWLNETIENGTMVATEVTTFRIARKNLKLQITCDISNQQDDDIHIGADLMKYLGYKFSMENISIDSNGSYIASSPYECNYVYNVPKKGNYLRNYFQNRAFFIKPNRVMKDDYGIPSSFLPNKRRRLQRELRSPSFCSDASTEPNSDIELEQVSSTSQ